jgi:hypothetical protein
MSYHLERYNKYKNLTIECPYCERELNLYNIYKHNTSKRCIYIQNNKFNEDELKDKKIKLILLIDKMRYNIRNNIND